MAAVTNATPSKQQERIGAMGRIEVEDVIDQHAEHQRQADADRKRDRHARQGDRGHQQDVGRVEDHAAQQGRADVGKIGLSQVRQKTAAVARPCCRT